MPLRPLDPTRSTRLARVLWVVALALSLLAAQALGLVHRIVHLAPASGVPAAPAAVGIAQDTAAGESATLSSPGGLHALFNGHEGGQCRLYDAHGLDSPVPLVLSLAAAVPVAVIVPLALSACAWRAVTGFDARGPPARA